MISYIRPVFSFKEYVGCFIYRRKKAAESLMELRRRGAKFLYVREKQRYCLSSFLRDIGWRKEKILMPAYTCSSLDDAVRDSGNIPLFYDITDDFKVDLFSLKKEAQKGIKAIIISDVYGIRMDIAEYLSSVVEKPLIIADYAHHESLDFDSDNRRYLDVAIFSSAYYKPISSSGVGILAVISNQVSAKDSVYIDDSFWASLIDNLKLFAVNFLLRSRLLKYVYRVSKHNKEAGFDRSRPATLVSLSHINKFFLPHDKTDRVRLNDLLKEKFRFFNPIQPLNIHKTYFSIVVGEMQKEAIHSMCLKKGVLLGNIFGVIAGKDSGHCPNALHYSKRVLNLPFLREGSLRDEEKMISTILEVIADDSI